MVPLLPPGSEIEVVPLAGQRVTLGDVIVFIRGETLVAHRLVHLSRGRWITQGDSCRLPDAPLLPGQAIGLVWAAYHDGQCCWSKSQVWPAAFKWVVRYHLLRAGRVARRVSQRWSRSCLP